MGMVTGNKSIERAGFGRFGVGGYDYRKKVSRRLIPECTPLVPVHEPLPGEELQEFLGDLWPSELGSSWRDTCLAAQQHMHSVACTLLQGLAMALDREASFFDEVGYFAS